VLKKARKIKGFRGVSLKENRSKKIICLQKMILVLCSVSGTKQFVQRTRYMYWRIKDMNKSYRLKIEQLLNEHKLTKELLINCIAKSDKKVSDLAYKEKQYRYVGCNNFKLELDNLIEYRQPFFDVLKDGYHMTLAEIKSEIAVADVNKIPTKKVIEQVRDMIETRDYMLV